jgi:hypothetical protein
MRLRVRRDFGFWLMPSAPGVLSGVPPGEGRGVPTVAQLAPGCQLTPHPIVCATQNGKWNALPFWAAFG